MRVVAIGTVVVVTRFVVKTPREAPLDVSFARVEVEEEEEEGTTKEIINYRMDRLRHKR